jgi:hypothetical protein
VGGAAAALTIGGPLPTTAIFGASCPLDKIVMIFTSLVLACEPAYLLIVISLLMSIGVLKLLTNTFDFVMTSRISIRPF